MQVRADAARTIEAAREGAGLSRRDLELLTKKAGQRVTESTIFNIERGVSKRPWPRTVMALADALGIDHAEVLETTQVAS